MLDRISGLIKAKRYEEAVIACEDALSGKPDDPRLRYLLSVAYFMSQAYEDAIHSLGQIIDSKPDHADALLLLANIYSWGYGDGYSKAPELYKQVLNLNNKEIDAYIGLAISRRSPGVQMTLQESIELLERALSIDPSRQEIHNNLAYAYWEAAEYQKASEHFEKLLEMTAPSSRQVIEEKLQAVKGHHQPKDLVYLGPALPRLP